MILTREQMLKGGPGRVFKTVRFEDLDGELRLGSLTADAALQANDLQAKKRKGEPVERQLILMQLADAVVDESGAPVFDSADSAAEWCKTFGAETLLEIVSAIPLTRAAEKKAAAARAEEEKAALGNPPVASPAG